MANDDIRLPPKWIELNLTKRECCVFIPTPEDDSLCQCGRKRLDHDDDVKQLERLESWVPSQHTDSFPTDAYGTVIFEGEHHANKAHYVRLSYDTEPELVIQLMTLVWGLEMPKLVMTIRGGNTNFELAPRLGKILRSGLIKAAKSTGAWIFTGGLNYGVTRHIGTAMGHEVAFGFRRGRIVTVGIAPWGVVEHRDDLIVRNRDRNYAPLEHAQSKFRLLNPRHSNFLLVDNGTVGKVGGDSYFRRRLEKCIANYPSSPHKGCDTPIVCIVIEGGLYTLRNIGDYLHDEPPTPVVIFSGTGRTADLISWVMKLPLSENDIESYRDEIYTIMVKMYHVNTNQCQILFQEVKRIVKRRNLITIFNPHSNNEEEFDTAILASIFRSQHWSPLQQLSLTLVWDRVDIATNEVFVYGREWSRETLEHAMMEALISNRLEFVSLLIEHGLNMQLFLTVSRLETLYNLDRNHSKLLQLFIEELAKISPSKVDDKGFRPLTLHDLGIAMSHMIGNVYKSEYISTKPRNPSGKTGVYEGFPDEIYIDAPLQNPFDHLFIWAILSQRHNLALLLWRHGEGSLAKALVAIRLNKFMINEICEEKVESNFALEYQNYTSEWEVLSMELLESCFQNDPKLARQLMTMELENWSKMTCLTLAVIGYHRSLLGHPCCQSLLGDLWRGALKIKNYATPKIMLSIIFPPMLFFLQYKTTEELKLLPHEEQSKPVEVWDSSIAESQSGTEREKASDTISLRTYESKSKASFRNIFRTNKNALTSFEQSVSSRDRRVDMDEVIAQLENDSLRAEPINSGGSTVYRTLDSNEHTTGYRVTIVEEEKPHFPSDESLLMMSPSDYNVGGTFLQHQVHYEHKPHSYITTRQTLGPWSKVYEFQKAPVTNFYRHSMAYLVFVCTLAYVILVPQNHEHMGPLEIFVVLYIVAIMMEIVREFLAIDALNFSQRWTEFSKNLWKLSDFGVGCIFMVGVGLRVTVSFDYGFLIYRVLSIYFNLRLYKFMGVHRFLGPKIVMMSRMLAHMAYFALIILVIIIAFGVSREAIRFPNTNPSWKNVLEAFLEPYVMMFGEVDTDALSPQCGDVGQPECPVGYWIIPVTWVVYMMVANILIVNVLIAVFNGIYSEIDAVAVEVWMFQRFTFVMEYEQKPLLPPPAIILSHIYLVLKWIHKRLKFWFGEQELLKAPHEEDDQSRIINGNDHRLKTFLTEAEKSIVFDFEEDNLSIMMAGRFGTVTSDILQGPPPGLMSQRPVVHPGSFDSIKDRMGLQQLKVNLRELCLELETHRLKLDKLITYWEKEQERSQDNADVLSRSGESDVVGTGTIPENNFADDSWNNM